MPNMVQNGISPPQETTSLPAGSTPDSVKKSCTIIFLLWFFETIYIIIKNIFDHGIELENKE